MPQEHRLQINGIEIVVFEWGTQQVGQPTLVFAHANSFHARVWDAVIKLLPEFHSIAIDLPGHGRSQQPAPPYNWRLYAECVVGVSQAFGLTKAIGIGHSLGGHAVTLAAAMQPDLFAALLLIDPVILPREQYVGVFELNHFSARRRNEWESPEAMIERFKERLPFNRWNPDVLRDYAEYGLLPNPNSAGYVLACAPEYEAATYNYASAANIYPEIATVRIPVTILRAAGEYDAQQGNHSDSPTAPDLAAQFPNAVDVPLPQYSHFIPMEAPELVAEYTRRVAEAAQP